MVNTIYIYGIRSKIHVFTPGVHLSFPVACEWFRVLLSHVLAAFPCSHAWTCVLLYMDVTHMFMQVQSHALT